VGIRLGVRPAERGYKHEAQQERVILSGTTEGTERELQQTLETLQCGIEGSHGYCLPGCDVV
jgi:hypothetical protein